MEACLKEGDNRSFQAVAHDTRELETLADGTKSFTWVGKDRQSVLDSAAILDAMLQKKFQVSTVTPTACEHHVVMVTYCMVKKRSGSDLKCDTNKLQLQPGQRLPAEHHRAWRAELGQTTEVSSAMLCVPISLCKECISR